MLLLPDGPRAKWGNGDTVKHWLTGCCMQKVVSQLSHSCYSQIRRFWWGAGVKFQPFWRAQRQVVCRITKPDCLIFYPALFSPGSSSRHSESEHQITSDAGRGRAPPPCRTDYLSRRPQFVRLKNRLSGALMRSARNCNTEPRPPLRVLWWLWRSIGGQGRTRRSLKKHRSLVICRG